VINTVILLIYAVLTSAALVLLKLGSASGAPVSLDEGKLQLNLGVLVLSGVALYALSFGVYTYLVSKNDLGYIIPVSTALVYVFIFLASFLIFKEAFTVAKVVGICLIFGGLVLLNLNK